MSEVQKYMEARHTDFYKNVDMLFILNLCSHNNVVLL